MAGVDRSQNLGFGRQNECRRLEVARALVGECSQGVANLICRRAVSKGKVKVQLGSEFLRCRLVLHRKWHTPNTELIKGRLLRRITGELRRAERAPSPPVSDDDAEGTRNETRERKRP